MFVRKSNTLDTYLLYHDDWKILRKMAAELKNCPKQIILKWQHQKLFPAKLKK